MSEENEPVLLDVSGPVAHLISTMNLYQSWEAGEHFTCGELDAMASLWLAAGERDGAASWLESHAFCDDEGDAHFAFYKTDDRGHESVDEDAITAYLDTLKGLL